MSTDEDLPHAEFAFPGPLRDALVGAILDGRKTSTTSLVVEYARADEPLPIVGARQQVLDSAGRAVAVIETTGVRRVSLAEVDLDHARDEGEGYETVAEWRAGHENFWHSDQMRAALGEPGFTVRDDTLLVLERFRLIRRLQDGSGLGSAP